ncbi:type VII secretion protein EsaA [Virgibacillus halodenitrificans]|uniref:type VII secretion protein EsaA n=1 Tax=Virgibacillus halodenitrificans TaxID=1482 RepID=UPI000EF4D565|nr:type VII secretion protein EsaA [Virgibacillus halodenitrificans]
MSEGLKSSLTLAAKILVILVLPLLLFRYVDSQPVPAVQEEEDEATRSVAVVNEDTGIIQEEEKLILGQEIPALLNEQKDYKWTVVNRSAAEQGFSNQKYDAIIYVPSTFSENIMTFKEDKPTKAALNYVIQPNLEAKDRQRIHREMATAKNKINEEMSTIYWSYVSKEVDNIRAQFDKILEKEVAFQDAMYSFYTPSSKTLAHEIDQHKNNLENILNQTDQINDVSSDSANAANEAENKMKTFTEALEAYKETQLEQQKLLEAAQTKNQEAIAAGMESYNKAMEESMAAMQEKLSQQSVVFQKQQGQLINRFDSMKETIVESKALLKQSKDIEEKLQEELAALSTGISSPDDKLKKAISNFKNASLDATLLEPALPASDENGVNFNMLEQQLDELNKSILKVKTEVNNGSKNENPPVDDKDTEKQKETATETKPSWLEVEENYQTLKATLEKMKNASQTNPGDVEAWKKYAKEWKENYESILNRTNEVKLNLIEKIAKTEAEILKIDDSYNSSFLSTDEKRKKTLAALVDYSEALSIFKATHSIENGSQQGLEAVQSQVDKLSEINKSLQTIMGTNNEDINLTEMDPESEKSFDEIVSQAENAFANYNIMIENARTNTNTLLENLQQNATEITNQLQTVNADTFEWQESPSLEYLDGQMVFSIQQGTASDLKQLSDLVTNLEENQSEITTNTKDLQAQISTVQKQSDELNNKWSVNVASTGLIREDAYEILGNTVVDGQENPFVYNHLANPVNVEGQVNGKVLSETEERVPPVVMFMIILISGLLIGFLSHYYSNNTYLVQGGLFLLLNLAVGMIISIYGLNLYELDDAQAIKWSVFTILLLMACANVVRGSLFIGPFVGWLASIAMIVFFITPLLNIVVPEFTFNNPVSNVYMGLQYGTETSFILTIIVLAAITLAISAFIYTLQVMRNKARVEPNEEKAS